MRNGVACTYVDSKGAEHYAVVESVTGTGDSGFKIVNLVFDSGGKDERREDVPNERDADGRTFWREGIPATVEETEAEPVAGEQIANLDPAPDAVELPPVEPVVTPVPVLGGKQKREK